MGFRLNFSNLFARGCGPEPIISRVWGSICAFVKKVSMIPSSDVQKDRDSVANTWNLVQAMNQSRKLVKSWVSGSVSRICSSVGMAQNPCFLEFGARSLRFVRFFCVPKPTTYRVSSSARLPQNDAKRQIGRLELVFFATLRL